MITGLRLNLRILWLCALAFLLAGSLPAQKITGNWQGTITPRQGKPLRMVLQVLHDDSGALKARIYSIDQGPTGDWADSVSLHDSTVKFVVGMIGLSYEGKLSSNGDTITGTWIQGYRTPFMFRKATKETAWAFPPIRRHTRCSSLPSSLESSSRCSIGAALAGLLYFSPVWATRHMSMTTSRLNSPASTTFMASPVAASASPAIPLPIARTIRPAVSAMMFLPSSPPSTSKTGSRWALDRRRRTEFDRQPNPEKVSGLIYLDPGYSALYPPALGDTQLDMIDARNRIEQLLPFDPGGPEQPTEDLLATLSQLEKDLQGELKMKRKYSPAAKQLCTAGSSTPCPTETPPSPSSTKSRNTPK